MPIYCDESGGINIGAMTVAAIAMDEAAADALLARWKAITGRGGELKGSRIDLAERALVFELFDRYDGRAFISEALRDRLPPDAGEDRDRRVYSALLADAVAAHLTETDAILPVLIDDGRYDPRTLELIRAGIARLLPDHNGGATLHDSRRSAGIQIADVIANSFLNLALHTERAPRIAAVIEPFLEAGSIRVRGLPPGAVARL